MPQRSWSLYRAFGLTFQSELPLPELRSAPHAEPALADVAVILGHASCPEHVAEVASGVRADGDAFWMEVPGVARLLVREGREIVVERCPGAAEGDVRAHLLGSAMGALLHQRGLLPLHASAIVIDGRAVAFIAPSGGGKSTLAMHLQHLGRQVIGDDLVAVDGADGAARVWPGLVNLKLWRASLETIDREPDGLEPVLGGIDKYRVPLLAPAEDRAYDLAAVVLLDWGEPPALIRLPGAAGVGALLANTFRGRLVAAMGRSAAHWRQCLTVFSTVDVSRLTRPRALDRLDVASGLVVSSFSRRASERPHKPIVGQ